MSLSSPDDPAPDGLLRAFGWDERWAADLRDAIASAGSAASAASSGSAGELVPVRVIGVDRGEVDVARDSGFERAGSSLVDDPDPMLGPCTGDWAALRPGTDSAGPELVALLPRRTAIVRASAGRAAQGQVLAANVDTVAIVASLTEDPFDLGRLERFVALAWDSGARPVVVLTKVDIADVDAGIDVEDVVAAATGAAPGVEVLVVSAATEAGLDELRAELQGTIVLIGASGAGKSTLANALLGEQRQATSAVRDVDGKGRHTTVRRELLALPGGGALIDTPGLRSVGLWDASEGLALAFADIDELAEGCRFRDCAHAGEPGCAVQAAVDAGDLPARRLDNYRSLQREIEWEAARVDARARAARKRESKAISVAIRQHYRDRGPR